MLRFLYKKQRYATASISIGGKRLRVLIADSFVKKMVGLMFRSGIGKDEGMLLVFGREARHGIWMHNMRFPIDIIWLDRGKCIVDFVESAMPTSRATYRPEKGAKYVLEVAAGFIKRNRIKKGVAVTGAL